MESQQIITAVNNCLKSLSLPVKVGIILLVFTFVCSHLPAQKIWEERKGCVSSQGNLAPGYLFAQKSVTAYFDGDIEMFLDDRYAPTGAIWLSFATTDKSQVGVRANHAIFWGFNYHFLKPSRFDPFIGITPGIGLARAGYQTEEGIKLTPYSPVPLIATTIGCNYYVGSIFHFFVKVQGVAGQMFSTLPVPKRLDELKFLAGLGWNIRVYKPKKHSHWGKEV